MSLRDKQTKNTYLSPTINLTVLLRSSFRMLALILFDCGQNHTGDTRNKHRTDN